MTRLIADGVDWALRWGDIVRERAAEAKPGAGAGFWDKVAPAFARSTSGRADHFIDVLEPYISPRATLIDVGAGAGRHAIPLADRMEWVTAVEPSTGMRAQMPHRDNMTIIASEWMDAEVAPADLVICCHVLYGVEAPVPFIEKLDRSARARVAIQLRQGQMHHPSTALWERLTGRVRSPQPDFSDLFPLLLQMGIAPDVTFLRYPATYLYQDMDQALADCRPRIDDAWDESRARELLGELLVPAADGLVFDAGESLAGVAHWAPRR